MVVLSLRVWSRAVSGLKQVPVAQGNSKPMRGLMPGKNAVIRTKQYLEQGIALRDTIRIMMITYGDYKENASLHQGARDLVSLNFSQLQFKNPNVQIVCVKNVTPTPFVTFYLDNGEKFYVDIEGKSQIEILEHLQKVVGKPRELIEMQTKAVEANPANFGENYKRKCICECEGQVECSSLFNVLNCKQKSLVTAKKRNPNPKKYPFGMEGENT